MNGPPAVGVKHFFIIVLVIAGCAAETPSARFDRLAEAFDAQRASGEAFSVQDLEAWADSFWIFRERYAGTPEGSEATVRSLELSRTGGDYLTFEERFWDVSVHDPAMRHLVPHLSLVVEPDELSGAWRRIARTSENPHVRAAALIELAAHFHLNKRYAHLANLLDTLAVEYGIAFDDERYGPQITRMKESVHTLSVGTQLPPFRTADLDGRPLASEDLKGKVVVLYFYGSGCGACIKMYPSLNALYSRHKDADFFLLGVSADRGYLTQEAFRAFLTEYEIEWPQTLESALFDQYEVGMLSTALMVDQSGRLVWISRSDAVIDAIPELHGKVLSEAVTYLVSLG